MKKYKMLKSPQSNEGVKIEYTMSNDLILKSEIFKYIEEEFQSEKTIYFDLSSLKDNTHYLGEYPVSSVITTETEIAIDVINTVGDEWTDDEANPEWFDITFEDFDIPEDAELLELEEMPAFQHKVDNEKQLLQAQVDILVEEAEFKDDLLQQLILEIYSTK